MALSVNLTAGDPAPWFQQCSLGNPRFVFSTAAGHYIVLCFFVSAAEPISRAALDAMHRHRHFFDDDRASFFGITLDRADEAKKRIAESYPGYRYFLDFDGSVSRLYGVMAPDADPRQGRVPVRRLWFVLDPTLRIMRVIPFAPDGSEVPALLAYLDSLPPPARFAGIELQAPILVLPSVFEPEFCRELVALYERHGGEESGFMREIGGKTVGLNDHRFKRRRDYTIEDPAVMAATRRRIVRRVAPEILKIHQFTATRMERYIVSCYAVEDAAHFRAHRDNTTKGTAHRRFAVSVNLNGDFDGGEVSFPEYGPRSFKAPVGGAVVFSCSLLHAVSQVTRGRRYAFLPFLYDDAAATIRQANSQYLAEDVGAYTNMVASA